MSDNDRTFHGDLVSSLNDLVEQAEKRPTATRKQVRSTKVDAEAPKYWSVKHQDWLSLDEMEYLKQRGR